MYNEKFLFVGGAIQDPLYKATTNALYNDVPRGSVLIFEKSDISTLVDGVMLAEPQYDIWFGRVYDFDISETYNVLLTFKSAAYYDIVNGSTINSVEYGRSGDTHHNIIGKNLIDPATGRLTYVNEVTWN